MSTPDWIAASSLARCTGRVEVLTAGGWLPQGTAFYIGCRTLLTCAHVIPHGSEVRVVMFLATDSPGHRADGELAWIPVSYDRYPDEEVPVDPYPFPDVAVLHIPDGFSRLPASVAGLDDTTPGDDLYAVGFTDEWIRGQVFGYPARFRTVGPVPLADSASTIWRMQGDRVRPGLSGAPVMDMATGRVVGMIKRSQDIELSIGAFFTSIRDILPLIPDDIRRENAKLDGSPMSNEAVARQLWGGLIDTAISCLKVNPDVLDRIARNLGLTTPTHDDPRWPVILALKLFTLDLRDLFRNIRPLVELIGSDRAFYLYDAVATCTNYKGEQWVAAEAAAELAAQVELLAADDVAAGRVIHLRTEYALGRVYHRRANQHSDWGRPLQCQVFSHEIDQVSGLPADIEYDLRSDIIARTRRKDKGPDPRTQGLDARELDDAQRTRWENLRPILTTSLREDHVVGMLPPGVPLDDQIVSILADLLSPGFPRRRTSRTKPK